MLYNLTVVHFNPEKREFSLLLNIPRPPYSVLRYNRTMTRTKVNVLINIGQGCGVGGKEEVKKATFPTLLTVIIASEATNRIILSFTNKAIENVKSQVNHNLRDKCYTLDSYFNSYHDRDISHLEDKTIYMEEYSVTSNKWMSKIYQASTKYHNNVFMFGDTNQCDPVDRGRRIH